MSPPPNEIDKNLVEKVFRAERGTRFASAVCFALLMICCGLPIWWYTTNVYRATFDSTLIQHLESEQIVVPLLLNFEYCPTLNPAVKGLLHDVQNAIDSVNNKTYPIVFKLTHTNNEIHSERVKIVRNSNLEDLKSLDKIWTKDSKGKVDETSKFELDIVLLDAKDLKLVPQIYFGSTDFVYIISDSSGISEMTVEAIVHGFINVNFMQRILLRTVSNNRSEDMLNSERDSKSVFHSSSHLAHDIDVYFFVPGASDCRLTTGKHLLKPFQKLVQPVTKLKITYHNVFDVNLNMRHQWNEQLQANVIPESVLPHLVTPLEKYVPTIEPYKRVLRLVVYVPPPELRPIIIVDKDMNPSINNAFVVASWGGINVWNDCNSTDDSLPVQLYSSLIGELRVLLNIENRFPTFPSPITKWETRRLILHSTVDNVLQSVWSMVSLNELLYKITNIVISDQVAHYIDTATQHSQITIQYLQSNDLLSALNASKIAFENSEKAFFDPSLLALLYFPDDQKYAIYIPLFLPAGIPIVLSLKFMYKYLTNKEAPLFKPTKND